jgi:hypothetical protein
MAWTPLVAKTALYVYAVWHKELFVQVHFRGRIILAGG